MPRANKLSDAFLFLQHFIVSRRQMGAIAPSSRHLARAMVEWLPMRSTSTGYVVELGAGTGPITHAIVERGFPQERLIAVEKSRLMSQNLQRRFPKAKIVCGDALELDRIVAEIAGPDRPIEAVISGLPLLCFPPETVEQLAGKVRKILGTKGKLVQYSYNLNKQCPPGLRQFERYASRVVWRNLPPARITVYIKKAQDEPDPDFRKQPELPMAEA